MSKRKSSEPEILPGADLDEDCQTLDTILPQEQIDLPHHIDDEEDDHEHEVTWDGLGSSTAVSLQAIESWLPRRAGWAHALEKIALWIERPFARITGSTELNPFYHTGMIASFLAIVVGISGFYIFLFFQYGIDASYNSVATRIEGPFIARVVRAVHRYASGALVVTTLLHAYRTLFMERFRGQRWLAWVTGIVMTFIVWLAGVTGYWLIADQRAQLINDGFISFLNRFSNLGDYYVAVLTQAELSGESWPLLLLLLIVHVVLYLIVVGFFVLHILRLKRAQFLPELHWTLGIGAVLLLVSALFPLGMLPKADPNQMPAFVTLDPLFLFYLPTRGNVWGLVLWGGLFVVTAVALVLPWLPRRRQKAHAAGDNPPAASIPLAPPKVNIIKDRCTGCTKCALDCPYGAIEMVERHDEKRHKFIAIEDPSLCVSCGICVGSCDGVAVTLGNTPPELLWTAVSTQLALAMAKAPSGEVKVVFTCERHAAHGAKPYLENDQALAIEEGLEIITLPCVGTAPPDLMVKALDAGAAEVQVIGCPPYDCANREGNYWAERRLTRKRVPRLKRAYANAPITAAWLPPDQFVDGLNLKPVMTTPEGSDTPEPNYLASRRMFPALSWRNFVAAFALLAVVMVIQVLLTDLPFRPPAAQSAHIRILLDDPAAVFNRSGAFNLPDGSFDLQLVVDDTPLMNYTYSGEELFLAEPQPFFEELPISRGDHHVQLRYVGGEYKSTTILFDEKVTFEPGNILRIHFQPSYSSACRADSCMK